MSAKKAVKVATPTKHSVLVLALEEAWEAIRAAEPETPEVTLYVGTGVAGGKLSKLGHFWSIAWIDVASKSATPEVMISGETLSRPAADCFGTLLHEAAHAINWKNGVVDTGKSGRYHRREFKTQAEKLGMTVEKVGRYGFASTELEPETAKRYSKTIEKLAVALTSQRSLTVGRSKKQARVLAMCGCDRRLRMSVSTFDQGKITCGVCDSSFEVVG